MAEGWEQAGQGWKAYLAQEEAGGEECVRPKDCMEELPDKIVRFDILQVEYGCKKLCTCSWPHYVVDYQNRLVRCVDCGAIVDAFEALLQISRDTERQEQYLKTLLEQRRQIDSYKPHRVVIKELEKRYVQSDRSGLEPVCPHCRRPFALEALVCGMWCNPAFVKNNSEEESHE